MTNQEIFESFQKMTVKAMTDAFNELEVSNRKSFLNYLEEISEETLTKFIRKIRDQAVKNFWNNERELISQGMGTREWTPEQMEQIYNISKVSGNMLIDAGSAKMIDGSGRTMTYQGHHMLNVDMYPEYAGEYKNVQPLLPDEHFAAHNGNTQLPTNWYYDPEAKTFFILDGAEVDFDGLEYPPYVVQTKGFRSDEALRSTYPIFDELTTGEKMALRYIDKTMVDSGTVEDLCEVFDKTQKYGSDRFKTIRIYVDDDNKIIADDLTDQLNGIDSEPPKQYWYDTTVEAIKDRSDDEKLREVFGEEFDTFDEVEKYQAKRLDRLIGSITDASHPPIFDDAVGRYLAATGKQADQLSQIDNIAINIGRKIAQNSPDISDVAKVLKKYEKIAKIGSKIGGVVDVVFTAVEWGLCVYSAADAFNNGDYEAAQGIIAGKVTEAVVTTAGGASLNALIAPTLMGIGGIVGGPLGVAVGGVIAGFISYGIAGAVGGFLNDLICDRMSSAEAEMQRAGTISSPLVIDFGNIGIATEGKDEGVYFDLNVNGASERTGWITGEDAFLALDLNSNGRITDGGELFGDHTKLVDGKYAGDGFKALAQYDTNQDGKIDRNDEIFDRLVLWGGKNEDGRSTEDEMMSLSDVEIDAIGLKTTAVNQRDAKTGVGDYWFPIPNIDACSEYADEYRNIHLLLRVA